MLMSDVGYHRHKGRCRCPPMVGSTLSICFFHCCWVSTAAFLGHQAGHGLGMAWAVASPAHFSWDNFLYQWIQAIPRYSVGNNNILKITVDITLLENKGTLQTQIDMYSMLFSSCNFFLQIGITSKMAPNVYFSTTIV
jgi:hypothetical protein